MHHELKIRQCFLIHIIEGRKTFEIRLNDRDFQVGDTISFLPIEDDNYNAYQHIASPTVDRCSEDDGIPPYRIEYIHTGIGMADGYCGLAIVPDKDSRSLSARLSAHMLHSEGRR